MTEQKVVSKIEDSWALDQFWTPLLVFCGWSYQIKSTREAWPNRRLWLRQLTFGLRSPWLGVCLITCTRIQQVYTSFGATLAGCIRLVTFAIPEVPGNCDQMKVDKDTWALILPDPKTREAWLHRRLLLRQLTFGLWSLWPRIFPIRAVAGCIRLVTFYFGEPSF